MKPTVVLRYAAAAPFELLDVLPIDQHLAGIRPIERADDVQDRALARAGRTDDRDGLFLAPPPASTPRSTGTASPPSGAR